MSATIAAARHLWTAEEYLRAAQAGVFAPDLRTELIEGEIIEMSAQGADHIRATMKTGKRLRETFAEARSLNEDTADVVMRDQRVRDVYLGKKAA